MYVSISTLRPVSTAEAHAELTAAAANARLSGLIVDQLLAAQAHADAAEPVMRFAIDVQSEAIMVIGFGFRGDEEYEQSFRVPVSDLRGGLDQKPLIRAIDWVAETIKRATDRNEIPSGAKLVT